MLSTQTPFALHPAWQWFIDAADGNSGGDANHAALKLAWRRTACRNPDAQAPSEKAHGGLLRLLESEGSPCRLPTPPGGLGTVHAYSKQKDLLSTAVCAHLRATTDPFYATEPAPATNYGGRGGSQQLWWCGSVRGWRGSSPNISSLGKRRTNTCTGLSVAKQSLFELTDEDIAGLPVMPGANATPETTPTLVKPNAVFADVDSFSVTDSMVGSFSMTDSADSESSSVWSECDSYTNVDACLSDHDEGDAPVVKKAREKEKEAQMVNMVA
eukprot:COSAG02_NODE_4063_length_5842_cov_25.729061_4_plen_270_part_00